MSKKDKKKAKKKAKKEAKAAQKKEEELKLMSLESSVERQESTTLQPFQQLSNDQGEGIKLMDLKTTTVADDKVLYVVVRVLLPYFISTIVCDSLLYGIVLWMCVAAEGDALLVPYYYYRRWKTTSSGRAAVRPSSSYL